SEPRCSMRSSSATSACSSMRPPSTSIPRTVDRRTKSTMDDHDHEDHGHPHGLKGAVLAIFAPHSHDAADSIDSALESSQRGIRAVKISFVALLVTSAFQLLVIIASGSVALLADTIHDFSDALTAIPLFL